MSLAAARGRIETEDNVVMAATTELGAPIDLPVGTTNAVGFAEDAVAVS